MIPQNIDFEEQLEVGNMPSKTWRINKDKLRVEDETNNLEAVKQTIDIILSTRRYEDLIYPDNFGHELDTLIGQEVYLIEAEAPRMIKEALLIDDRIIDCIDFIFRQGAESDEIVVSYTVVTIYGNIEIEKQLER